MRGCAPATSAARRRRRTRRARSWKESGRRAAQRAHLDERRVRALGGRHRSRPDARPALRHRGLRGHPLLRDRDRPGDLPPHRPPRPSGEVGRAVLHAADLRPRAAARGDQGAHRPQRAARLLHPPDRLPRLRDDGPVPARRAGGHRDRRVGVGGLPRRGVQDHRRARQGGQLAADLQRLADPARQGVGPVPQLDPGQDRDAQGRLRGGHPPRRPRLRLRGLGREHLRRARRRHLHAAADRGHPRRHQPKVGHAARARPRLRARRARHRPRRAVPGRRDLPDRHRRRARPRARGRRPPDRLRRARRGHARRPAGLRGRALRPHRALPRVARPRRDPGQRLVHDVQLYDATLRDGMQGEGLTLTAPEQLRVVHALDTLGVDLIEAGFPASNPKEAELFGLLAAERLEHAEVAAFGMTRRRDVRADDDPALRMLADCFAPVCTLVGKTWTLHLDKVVRVSREENLAMIADSVAFLVREGKRVVYDAEHFFDGYRADRDYALACLGAAAQAGAETVVLCDTNGSSLPSQVTAATADALGELGGRVRVGIHTHNDMECGVANALAAVEAGAGQVQGTMNGVGERTGNANLVSIVANLQLKLGRRVVTDAQLAQLTPTAHFVDELLNRAPHDAQPYVGTNAFAHKGGLHVAGVRADAATFEHVDPALVGNHRELLISELSGKATVAEKAADKGIDLDDAGAARAVERVKALEHAGYHFEAADGSFELLLRKEAGDYVPLFRLESWRVIVEQRADGKVETEATVKVWRDGERHVCTAEGNGPVNALDGALRLALGATCPDVELTNFKVRILDEAKGTDAVTRVLLETTDGQETWGSIGVSENVIAASWEALVDSLELAVQGVRSPA